MVYTWKKWKRFYEDLLDEYTSKWQAWDEVVYDVCTKYHGHSQFSGIAAKIGVMGKSERSGFIGPSEKDLVGLVEFLYKRGEAVDRIFKRLPAAGPLDAAVLEKIAALEGELAGLLLDLKKHPDTTRSFASKYMHFHCPAVPIYDVRSEEVLLNNEWYPPPPALKKSAPPPRHAEERYFQYCRRFLSLYQDLRKMAPGLTVKVVDYYLLEEYYRFKRHQL